MDIFHYGKCDRLCPEAPAPVFNSVRTVLNGGMAMNVFNNVLQFTKKVKILTNDNWKQVKKTRFVEENSNHMFMRLDENDDIISQIKRGALKKLKDYKAIIVSDYNKGFLAEQDLEYISSQNNNVFLDSKKILGEWANNFTLIKINGNEYEKTKSFLSATLREKTIVTQGPKGCIYREERFEVPPVEVKDVSGAGDTFMAALCYKLIEEEDIKAAIRFANNCATKVVQKKGVNIV